MPLSARALSLVSLFNSHTSYDILGYGYKFDVGFFFFQSFLISNRFSISIFSQFDRFGIARNKFKYRHIITMKLKHTIISFCLIEAKIFVIRANHHKYMTMFK